MEKSNKDASDYVIKYLKVRYIYMYISTLMHLPSDAQLTKAIENSGIFSPYNLFAGEGELYPAQYYVVSEI